MGRLIEVRNPHNWVYYINPDHIVAVREEFPMFDNVVIVMDAPVLEHGSEPTHINIRPAEWDRIKPLLAQSVSVDPSNNGDVTRVAPLSDTSHIDISDRNDSITHMKYKITC